MLLDADGVLELNSSAGAISIGNDADEQAINVGTGAAARTITVGNVTGTTAVNLNAGTGGIALASTGTGDITLNSDDTMLLDADGVLELNSSAGEISIGNDNVDQTINLATGGSRTLNIGINDGTDVTTLAVKGNSTHTGTVTVGVDGTGHDVKFFGDTAGKYMLWDQSSDTLEVQGTVQATNVIAVSDGTLKTNISPLNDPLATINKLNGVQYDWKDPNNSEHEIGLIAQDVEEVVPEVVRTLAGTNLKGVEYQKLTAILIEAVKELSNQVNELKNN